MNKVWVYNIVFYWEDDEYGYSVYQDSLTEVFFSREAAERWKKDFEDPKNIEYIRKKYHYRSQYISAIEEKEILNY